MVGTALPPQQRPGLEEIARRLLARESAAALLLEAKRRADPPAVVAAVENSGSVPLLIDAAEFLQRSGDIAAAERLLRMAAAIDGPTAPTQQALARNRRAAGDLEEARKWLVGAMFRARANAAQALDLCEIELALGSGQEGRAAELAIDLRWIDADGLRHAARGLIASSRPEFAVVPLMMLQIRREATDADRVALAELFAAHRPFASLPASVCDRLRLREDATAQDVRAAVIHDKLAAHFGAEPLEKAAIRERSSRWVDFEGLYRLLGERIRAGEPFSFVRAGDGEARFLIGVHERCRHGLSASEAATLFRIIWHNWFGQNVEEVEPSRLAGLATQFGDAFRNADLIGLTTAHVLRHDPWQFGYRAVLEEWLDGIHRTSGALITDAAHPGFLHIKDPFFRSLLADIPFIGLISPHRQLADRLRAETGCANVVSYLIPGETRLGRPLEASNRGTHFPGTFDRIMAEIEVPFRGACFLVAGGLLGKIYCDRIKRLGGVALDIGALADAWMGFDTRGGGFERFVSR